MATLVIVPSSGMGNGTARLLKLSYCSGKTVVIPTVRVITSARPTLPHDRHNTSARATTPIKAGDDNEILLSLGIFYSRIGSLVGAQNAAFNSSTTVLLTYRKLHHNHHRPTLLILTERAS